MNSSKIATWKQLSPVFLPLFFVAGATGALRAGTAIRDAVSTNRALPAQRGPVNLFNPTEATFLRISQITAAIDSGNDAEALNLLQALRDSPISTDGNTFRSADLRNFSPSTYLMGVGYKLSARAQYLKESGKDAVAYEYVRALYSIGDNILASKTPSIKALRTVHFFHGLASGTEGRFYTPNSRMAVASASQHTALKTLWQQIIPQLGYSPDDEVASAGEQAQASRLFSEYRDQWFRIRRSDV